jgi:glycine cleavage system H protein
MVTLIFVAVLLLAVALDLWLIRPWEVKHLARPPGFDDALLEFVVPRTLFFHPGHSWARLDEDGQITVGVDDLARTVIGDFSAIESPAIGAQLTAGLPAFGIRLGKRLLRLAAPVSGTVTEINAVLGKDHVRLRWRPYKEGWIYRVAPGEQLSAELKSLAIGQDSERWMAREIVRLRDLFESGQLAPPVEGAMQRASDEAWTLVQRNILQLNSESKEPSA